MTVIRAVPVVIRRSDDADPEARGETGVDPRHAILENQGGMRARPEEGKGLRIAIRSRFAAGVILRPEDNAKSVTQPESIQDRKNFPSMGTGNQSEWKFRREIEHTLPSAGYDQELRFDFRAVSIEHALGRAICR